MNAEKVNLVSVYKVPDELAGLTIKSLLEKEGIKAVLRSRQIPMYDSIMVTALGYWGEILVIEKNREKAKVIIDDFVKVTKK